MRAALFSGYNPDKLGKREDPANKYDRQQRGGGEGAGGGYNPYADEGEGGGGGAGPSQEEEDEDVEMIKKDLRGVKQETLGSTK
jgi:hypothetical protein